MEDFLFSHEFLNDSGCIISFIKPAVKIHAGYLIASSILGMSSFSGMKLILIKSIINNISVKKIK